MPSRARRTWVRAAALLLAGVSMPVAGQPSASKPVPADLDALGDRAVTAVPGKANQTFIEQARALAAKYRGAGDPQSEARAWQLAGYFSMLTDDNAASTAYSDRALGICKRIGDLPCVTRTAINGAVAYKRAEQLPKALERLQLAVAVAQRTGETERALQARYNLANVQHTMGDALGALATFESLAQDYPDANTTLGSLLTAARIHVELGQAAPALGKARAALSWLARNRDVSGWTTDAITSAQSTMGLAYALAGDRKRATEHLDRALRRAQRSGSDEELFDVNARYAWGWQLLKRSDRALSYTRVAYALRSAIEERDRPGFLQRAAEVFEAAGDDQSASAARREALGITRKNQDSAMRQATASATASVGLAERNMLVSKLQLDRAEERARLERTRLIAISLVAGLLILAVAIVARIRFGQLRRQQAAVLDERTRVARELHDTLIQGFTGVTLQLQQAARAAPDDLRARALSNAAAASLSEARNAVWQMRSEAIEQGDLRTALSGWIETVQDGAVTIESALDDLPPKLPPDHAENLLRFAQEAVTNALRHAEADQVAIRAARVGPRTFRLIVSDNGRGFDAGAADPGHWGLIGMRERVERAGGRFALLSRPGEGTRVEALIHH